MFMTKLILKTQIAKGKFIKACLIGGLCLFSQLHASSSGGSGWSHVNQSVSAFLDSSSEVTIFLAALKQTDLWYQVEKSGSQTLFVPSDTALRNEGSAFLLEVVLPKVENKERLNQLMAMHIYQEEYLLDASNNQQMELSVPGGGCFEVTISDGLIKVGPQAKVTASVTTSNGTIHIVDHLLWQPYEEADSCTNQQR